MRWILPQTQFSGSVVEQLLQARGLSPAEFTAFLTPGHEAIHDPALIYGIEAAADEILAAVKAGKKIFIHGDYDVDGVCATSLMWMFMKRALNADVLPKIPNRFDEGYGLSKTTVDDIISQGGNMIITVDCGVKDGELISAYAKDAGLQFVVTDHHAITGDLPENIPVVHPRHPSGNYPFPDICGTTVAWKLCQILARRAGLPDDLMEYIDLVALATVCDVMPLLDENRAIVRLGIAAIQNSQRPGIAALLSVAGIKPADLKTFHFGFTMGPKLNAAGRLQDAMIAVRLLSTENEANAREYAAELNNLNQERQTLTMELLQEAEAQISKFPAESKLYFVYGDEWPEGVVGLVAGKLTEKYGRPVLVASRSTEGIIKGSARSIKQFHIAEALKAAEAHLQRHGGHAMAAGFTLHEDNLEALTQMLAQLAAEQITDADLVPSLHIDMVMNVSDLQPQLISELKQLEPFGFGNPSPVIAVLDAEIAKSPRIFGSDKQHVAFMVRDGNGGLVEVVDWGGSERWGSLKVADHIAVAGAPGVNEWNGNQTPQIVAKDILLPPDIPQRG